MLDLSIKLEGGHQIDISGNKTTYYIFKYCTWPATPVQSDLCYSP